jgi:hypothetical protein
MIKVVGTTLHATYTDSSQVRKDKSFIVLKLLVYLFIPPYKTSKGQESTATSHTWMCASPLGALILDSPALLRMLHEAWDPVVFEPLTGVEYASAPRVHAPATPGKQ